MAKKEKVVTQPVVQTEESFEAQLKSEPQVFDSVTLGISSRSGGGYNIVKIGLDSKGLVAGAVEVLDTAENKWEANEKFKINVIKQGII